MSRLLKIPTGAMTRMSMEQRRDPEDADIIPLDDAPVEAPVVDAGVGTAGDAAQSENADALAATVSEEAPAAAEADPAADAAADSSVTDAASEPAADAGTPPDAAGDTAAAAESDLMAPEAGGADGDTAPVPDVDPAAPADTANNPADATDVQDNPAVDPEPETAAAPAGEEQTQAVVDDAAAVAAQTDPTDPVDAADPVAPSETVPEEAAAAVTAASDAAPDADLGLPEDVAGDSAPPVAGEAPVVPEGDALSAPSGTDVAADLSADTTADAASAEPAADVAAPADAATDPLADDAPAAEAHDPMADVPAEELTSAWVDGVSVDAEEIKAQLDDAANDVVDADYVTDELEDAAVALEALRSAVSKDLTEENPAVSDTTVNLVRIAAEKSLHHIGEVLNLPASMESAATPYQRLQVTLESIGEKVKQIWEAIKKAVMAAWQALVEFFKGLFDSAVRVKQSIVKMRGAVKSMNANDKPTNPTVGTATVVKNIAFAGFKNYGDLKASLSKFDGAVGPFLENSQKAIHDAIVAGGQEMIELAEASADVSSRDYNTVVSSPATKAVLMFGNLGRKMASAVAEGGSMGKGGEGVAMTRSGELPGGYYVQVFVPDLSSSRSPGGQDNAHSKFIDVMTGNHLSIQHQPDAKVETLPVLSESEMLEILDVIEATVDSVLASKATVSRFEKDIKDVQRTVDQKLIRSQDDWLEKTTTRMTIVALTRLGPNLVKMNSQFMSLVVSIANNVVKYVSASCREYPSFNNAPKGSVSASASEAKTDTGTGLAVA